MAHQQQQRALRRLLQHFEQRIGADRLSSSTASTMATRQPPSPAVEPKNATRAAHVVDRDVLAQDALVVERALEDEEIGLGLRRDPARHRMLRIDGERRRLSDFGRRRVGMRQHEARQAISQRRLADALGAGDQEGVGNAAAAIGGKQRRLGAGVAEQHRGRARVRRFAVFACLRAHDAGFTRPGFPAPAHPAQAARWPDRAWPARCPKYPWRPARAARWHR